MTVYLVYPDYDEEVHGWCGMNAQYERVIGEPLAVFSSKELANKYAETDLHLVVLPMVLDEIPIKEI